MRLYEVTDLRYSERRKAWVNPDRITYARPHPICTQVAETWEEAKERGIAPMKLINAVWVGFTSSDGVIVSPEEFEVLQKAAGIEVVKANAA